MNRQKLNDLVVIDRYDMKSSRHCGKSDNLKCTPGLIIDLS